jgi:hypothetical protein
MYDDFEKSLGYIIKWKTFVQVKLLLKFLFIIYLPIYLPTYVLYLSMLVCI